MAASMRMHASSSLSGLEDRDIDEIVGQSTRWIDELRGARVLVTGATGWFGTWLLDALVALDHAFTLGLRIVATSRHPDRFAARHAALAGASQVEWLAVDVRDPGLAIDGPVTHAIHMATDASATLNATAPGAMFDTIVAGTRHVLHATARAGAKRALLVSSGAVYGPQPRDVARLDETYLGSLDPLAVANAYAEGKRAAEQIAAISHAESGLETVIARCFAFVGPHMPFDAHFAIGNFMRDALERDAIVVRSDGRACRSYLYMTDLVVWLLALLVDGRPLRAYNVGSSDAVSIDALAKRCAAIACDRQGRSVDVRIDGSSPAGPSYVPATARIEDELGVRATVGLDDAIARTMAWRRSSMNGGTR